MGDGKAISHRPQRPNARALRSRSALWVIQYQSLLLACKVPRRRWVLRPAAFRCSRLPDRRLRRRKGLCTRLHAELSHAEAQGGAVAVSYTHLTLPTSDLV